MIGTKLIIAISIVITVAAFFIERQFKNRKKMPEFQRKGPLFSIAERAFLNVLEQAVEQEGRVFGMVRIADILRPIRGLDSKEWRFAFDWIQNTHFDFIICDPETMAVICAIELRDDANPRKDWNDRDEFLAGVCASAGLPLIRLPWRPDYSVSEIRALVLTHLSSVEMPKFDESKEKTAIRPADYAEEFSAD